MNQKRQEGQKLRSDFVRFHGPTAFVESLTFIPRSGNVDPAVGVEFTGTRVRDQDVETLGASLQKALPSSQPFEIRRFEGPVTDLLVYPQHGYMGPVTAKNTLRVLFNSDLIGVAQLNQAQTALGINIPVFEWERAKHEAWLKQRLG